MIERQTVFQGKRFNVERVTATDSRGKTHVREIVRHPGAVVILPILDDQRIVMIENFRIAVETTLLELPAGTLEPNEAPATTAERELIEETGYRAEKIEQALEFFASPGIMDEKMVLYFATGLTEGAPEREEGEEITNRIMTWEEVHQAMRDGKIRDAKSIIGILTYLRRKNGEA